MARQSARLTADRSPGPRVSVGHHPRNPADAVLVAGVEGSDRLLLLFMMPFNGVMLVFWVGGWYLVRRKWRKPASRRGENNPAIAHHLGAAGPDVAAGHAPRRGGGAGSLLRDGNDKVSCVIRHVGQSHARFSQLALAPPLTETDADRFVGVWHTPVPL